MPPSHFSSSHFSLNPTPRQLIIALDVDSTEEAMALVHQLKPLGVTFKIGMELYFRGGIAIAHAIQEQGCFTFLDLKLHDIPNTVRRSSEVLASQGVNFFNVHATGGPEMLKAAVEGARVGAEKANLEKPMLIAVTLLTSLSEAVLHEALKVHGSLQDYVVYLAEMAKESGLDGVVCSAQEANLIRKACGPEFVLVTPGIRPKSALSSPTIKKDDQARVVTPAEAFRQGAHFIVVGRPITQAADPLIATRQILDDMCSVNQPSIAP